MNHIPEGTSRTLPLADPVQAPFRWLLIPSWLGSIVFHVVLAGVILYLSQLPSCRRETGGDGGGDFRYAGIELLPPGPVGEPGPPGSHAQQSGSNAPGKELTSPKNSPEAITSSITPPTRDAAPPIPLNLPKPPEIVGIIGPGSSQGMLSTPLDSLVRPANGRDRESGMPGGAIGGADNGSGGIGGTGTGTGGGGGGTSFLGVKGTGKRFVYVIDRSFSMASDNALQAAKLELMASLQRLNETQQFQVIFYNTEYAALNPRGGRFDLFRGTDAQRLLVMEQIRQISPAEGTRHLPAILEALNFKPDVIFLLSDGDATTALDMKDLETIRIQNRGRAHINCIEFGRTEKSNLGEAGNFLKVLARENGGQYAYRNVKAGF